MSEDHVRRVVVVGGGMAGLRCAEALRTGGYEGTLTILGAEPHLSYDRPPLSKAYIRGEVDQDALTFTTRAQLEDQGIEFRFGRALRLDARSRTVITEHGVLGYDRAVIATGAGPRRLPGVPEHEQPHVLRTIDDAVALRGHLSRSRTLTVVGGGLIGCEVAATARSLGLDVTLVEAGPGLLLRSFGDALGDHLERLHRDRGVRVVTGVGVQRLVPRRGDAPWQVTLASGETHAADVVVAGIGADPVTHWLAGSGVAVDAGVLCNASLTTSAPDVMAAGDVARFRSPDGELVRSEQWINALDQARHVARNLLLDPAERSPFGGSDYFWSNQYGLMLQGVGTHHDAEIVVDDADPNSSTFLARAVRGGVTVGIFAAGFTREFAKARRALTAVRA